MNEELFTNNMIDSIQANEGENYFSPILRDGFLELGRLIAPRIVDVGCGNGVFTCHLKKEFPEGELFGVDGSEYALENAKEHGFDQVFCVENFDRDQLPLEDGMVDAVICKDVLEHLLHPDHLMNEITRILKKDGIAVLHVPNHFPLYGRLRFLFSNNIDTWGYFPDSPRWRYPHIRFFTHDSLKMLCETSGLSLVKDYSENFPLLPANSLFPSFIKTALARIYPDHCSEGFTLKVRKMS